MKEFKIYLAGGMGNLSWDEQNTWRDTLKEYLLSRDSKYKLNIINPCDYFNFKERKYRTQSEVKAYDLRHVRTSDLVIVNYNDPKSIGTAMELELATELNIPIIGLNEKMIELHPWLVDVTNRMCNTFKELTTYIDEFYLL
jgi:nucleoside 2-deoxyribosyltransferase